MGPGVRLDRCGKSRPTPGFDPRTVQPVARSYLRNVQFSCFSLSLSLSLCFVCVTLYRFFLCMLGTNFHVLQTLVSATADVDTEYVTLSVTSTLCLSSSAELSTDCCLPFQNFKFFHVFGYLFIYFNLCFVIACWWRDTNTHPYVTSTCFVDCVASNRFSAVRCVVSPMLRSPYGAVMLNSGSVRFCRTH